MDASDIEVLTALEAIRRRPGMYLEGDLADPLTLNKLLKASVCHAIDECIDGRCSRISIELEDGYACVEYDAGMPLTVRDGDGPCAAEIIMTRLHACRNMKKHIEVGDQYCKVGISVLTALTDKLILETASAERYGTQVYRKGVVAGDFEFKAWAGEDFTRLRAWVDRGIFEAGYFDEEEIRVWASDVMHDLVGLDIQVFKPGL